jgi:transposase
MPEVSSEAMNHHLVAIAKAVQPGAHAVITVDGAGWHQTGRRLKVPENISLLPLPPYSPELNPVENIWQFLRQNFLAHRLFDTYDDIVNACCSAWNKLCAIPGKLRDIATREWAEQVNI